jgi:histidinol-phosphatase (PHP family)
MVDFHVHSDYSIDAEGSVGEYVEAALEAGLSQICFTTHCDLDPLRLERDGKVKLKGNIVDVTSDWLESYVDEVRQAARSCAGRLKVLCGLEVGYVPGTEPLIEKTIGAFKFDYVLCGVHTLAGIDIVSPGECRDYFIRRSPGQVCEEYFASVRQAAASGLFDSIAHLDIYKKSGLAFHGEALNAAHQGFLEPALDEMARRSTCLEINSAALRKGLRYPYPSPDLLALARQAGVANVTLGSDCHKPADVACGLGTCIELARQSGFDEVAVFEARARATIPLRALARSG